LWRSCIRRSSLLLRLLLWQFRDRQILQPLFLFVRWDVELVEIYVLLAPVLEPVQVALTNLVGAGPRIPCELVFLEFLQPLFLLGSDLWSCPVCVFIFFVIDYRVLLWLCSV